MQRTRRRPTRARQRPRRAAPYNRRRAAAQPAAPQLVYALGQLSYDLVSEARLDSLAQKIAAQAGVATVERALAFDPRRLLAYLEENPWDAAAVEWTLNLDGSPIYAVRPRGPFAAETYAELRQFLADQLNEGVERVSIPGVLSGKATLLLGQGVPAIVPERRGMYSWTTPALIQAVVGPAPTARAAPRVREEHERKSAGVRNFLDRVYHALRNLGIMAQERALNFAATNAFEIEKVFESALKDPEKMEFENINVSRSPVCRPSSDCWDVELYFFYPERQVQTVRKVYRVTVDVSDVVPVTIGPMRCVVHALTYPHRRPSVKLPVQVAAVQRESSAPPRHRPVGVHGRVNAACLPSQAVQCCCVGDGCVTCNPGQGCSYDTIHHTCVCN